MSTLDALQAALAGEHACIYGYGLLGARASDRDLPEVRATRDLHRDRRERLRHQITIRRGTPVAALPAYVVPLDLDGPQAARALAALLERRLAVLYADLVAITSVPELREFAAETLVESSVLATRWSGTTTALPGLDGVPDPE